MKIPKRFNARSVSEATAITMGLMASIHLLAGLTASITTGKIYHLNPVNLLGLDVFFPSLQTSTVATFVGWVIFCSIGLVLVGLKMQMRITIAKKPHTATAMQSGELAEGTVPA